MAQQRNKQLPCDSVGVCMICNQTPLEIDILHCRTCATPWHVPCLPLLPLTIFDWICIDCSQPVDNNHVADAPATPIARGLVSTIHAIENDTSLTSEEKAKKRQVLIGGSSKQPIENNNKSNEVFDVFNSKLNCSICLTLLERPITTPCGHNFCLKCFEKWVKQGKRNCSNCRTEIPAKMASDPQINVQLATTIQMARSESVAHGKIFVTIPKDHFGPIVAENDPTRKRGVLVGDTWESLMECMQWGAHFPHDARTAGQSSHGVQSVALSGGYIDDIDHGNWFLYSGSSGRDLSGSKRTNKNQFFDKKSERKNEAFRLSCQKGYPIRVVRSHKKKRSSYAPKAGVRYDGVYRIEKWWRKIGKQGHKVCRYLFVRCDNEPAPWTSDLSGDRLCPLPIIEELNGAVDITERKGDPSWDFDEEKGCWLWKKPPPLSKKPVNIVDPIDETKIKFDVEKARRVSLKIKDRLLKELGCTICHKVLASPLTTPCAHNFCKACLEGVFSGQSYIRERASQSGFALRTKKNIMKCPTCSTDIVDYLPILKVNTDMKGVIESLQRDF
ncbi:E3 ubiquitin-protein ligase ORTHRUS 2-like isoform X1 [Vicia villosa]|uniref:E3 ubiquitin-protein ligase ORTHRUS 2-like isoform X1 n=2 Tax=Vicia villosa TaxID=3911 RepID=UPI00273AB678|nr:E3 ubiquitin-protein ligase ORTHRUS 2-like isoform X1 [Vicia villosa]